MASETAPTAATGDAALVSAGTAAASAGGCAGASASAGGCAGTSASAGVCAGTSASARGCAGTSACGCAVPMATDADITTNSVAGGVASTAASWGHGLASAGAAGSGPGPGADSGAGVATVEPAGATYTPPSLPKISGAKPGGLGMAGSGMGCGNGVGVATAAATSCAFPPQPMMTGAVPGMSDTLPSGGPTGSCGMDIDDVRKRWAPRAAVTGSTSMPGGNTSSVGNAAVESKGEFGRVGGKSSGCAAAALFAAAAAAGRQ